MLRNTKACIVLPTYNEADNIEKVLGLISSIDDYYDEEEIKVLVVDDNSPDGTGEIVKRLMKKNRNVHLLTRKKKEGLGAAYIAGFRYAMKHFDPEIIFEMDADLSHNPSYIVPMIHQIESGADVVIGSRYIKGGKTPENWGLHRELISSMANTMARSALINYDNIKDITGGFRAIRTDALRRIDLNILGTKGYAFQIALLNELMKHHVRMKEFPIYFENRTHGESKMSFSDIKEVGTTVFRIGMENMITRMPWKDRAYT